jgi:hypothetical protein
MPIQLYSFARGGLYLGLVQKSSLRATFMLVWILGLLPWLLFIGFIFTMEFMPRLLGILRPMTLPIVGRLQMEHITAAWAFLHLLVCTWFLRKANWNLRGKFRTLAAQGRAKQRWRVMLGI